MDGPTDRPTDQQTEKASFRVAFPQQKNRRIPFIFANSYSQQMKYQFPYRLRFEQTINRLKSAALKELTIPPKQRVTRDNAMSISKRKKKEGDRGLI